MHVDAEGRRLLTFASQSTLPGLGFGWLNADGAVDDSQGVHTWVTGRMTHVFSLATLSGEPGARELATAGVRSLLHGPLRDREHGGWLGSVDLTGEPVADRKLAYDHAFVILAGSSAVAAQVQDADQLLDDAVECFERWFLDASGRVVDNYPRAFGAAEAYRGANSSMHTVEALLALGDVRFETRWHRAALGIAEHLIGQVAHDFGNRLPEHYDADWTPLPAYNVDHKDDPFRPYGVTPGHLLEWARLLLDIECTIPDAPEWLVAKARDLFAVAVEIGWAADGAAGFVYTTDWHDQPVVRNRMHWVHAEAVAAAAALAARTGLDEYSRWQEVWWGFIEDHFIETATTSANWRHEADAQNRPVSQVWSGRPDIYHGYQALMLRQEPLHASLASALSPR